MSDPVESGYNSWQDVARWHWGQAGPFTVVVDGQPLHAEEILRHLPGRRLAVRAKWDGRTVFAKLFFAGGQKEAHREAAYHKELVSSGLTVPALLHESVSDCGTILITEWVEGQAAEAMLRGERGRALIRGLTDCVFSLYRANFLQTDLHLGNFLFDGRRFVVVDFGDMASLSEGWRRSSAILGNLALFCAQAPLDLRDLLITDVIQKLRQMGINSASLQGRVRRQSDRRLCRAMKKWRRESSAIAAWRDENEDWLWSRELSKENREQLAAALRTPDSFPLIKKGSRISVYGEGRWIIK